MKTGKGEIVAIPQEWLDEEAELAALLEAGGADDATVTRFHTVCLLIDTARRAAAPRYVYFIGGDATPIKIGFAEDPRRRFRSVQAGVWMPLQLLALVEGTRATERAYHKRFKQWHIRGEWFTRCPEIEAEIARLTATPVQTYCGEG